jgi:alpha-beta hydrolase superfamily lysophospholipase
MHEPYESLPQAIRRRARIELLGPTAVPTLLIEPEGAPPRNGPPCVLWLHGRTAWKELDPGRFLRLMRSGIAVIAPDLPGHGQRFDAELQDSRHVLDVVRIMLEELDALAGAGVSSLGADPMRTGLGGMSAGGMVAIARLTRPHTWRCVVLEATTGSWAHQRARPMFARRDAASIAAIDPVNHLSMWHPIPVLAVHSKADEWVDWRGQAAFLDAIERRGDPGLVERLVFDRTGAEHEHVGFGRFSAEVKERERAFYREHLAEGRPGLS